MRILIDQGCYQLNNFGDIAMLQTAVQRVRQIWPESVIHVFTTNVNGLEQYCPGTIPISPYGRDILGLSFIRLESRYQWINKLYLRFQQSATFLGYRVISMLNPVMPSFGIKAIRELKTFVHAIRNIDLFLTAGGGFINNHFTYNAHGVFTVLGLAIKLGKPRALLGQGMGPIDNAMLFERASYILQRLHILSIREKISVIPLLRSMSVPSDIIMITGDDAIEMAYTLRTDTPGKGIGVNLRLASYSAVGNAMLLTVRKALYEVSKIHDAVLIPAPIFKYSNANLKDSDIDAIKRLFDAMPNQDDFGDDLDTPEDLIRKIGLCRVVITGSYHAAVFALSQGIPVVALASSKYYEIKFSGLMDQFRLGSILIDLNQESLEKKIVAAVSQLWEEADILRPKLLSVASEQIEAGKAAYSRLKDVVNIPG